jgi:hypothetical protein
MSRARIAALQARLEVALAGLEAARRALCFRCRNAYDPLGRKNYHDQLCEDRMALDTVIAQVRRRV